MIPAQPPRGVSTIQGNFLSESVQNEVKRFIRDGNGFRGHSVVDNDEARASKEASLTSGERSHAYLDNQAKAISLVRITSEKTDDCGYALDYGRRGAVVDVILSDMSAPWDQTDGFWKRSISDPYFRMMNTSGMSFRDHAGSMVSKSVLSLKRSKQAENFHHLRICVLQLSNSVPKS